MYRPDAHPMVELVLHLCDDLAAQFPTLSKGLRRDKEYISSRFSSEGLSFLTVSLPKYGKAFDEWLRDEKVSYDSVEGELQPILTFVVEFFSPDFLAGVWRLLLNSLHYERTFEGVNLPQPEFVRWLQDRTLRASERAAIYRWIRQLCFVLYKLEVPFDERQLDEAYCSFEERDKELEQTDCTFSFYQVGEAGRILADAVKDFNPDIRHPKHGPGAVATGEVGDDKWIFKRHYASVHRRFPWYDYFVPTPLVWHSDPQSFVRWYKSLERLNYPEARVVAVPKDSRGPRLISEEPLELQFLQQGYSTLLVDHLERRARTSGFVNFARQDINQQLALDGSKTGEWATIDLSDASDRVSDYLVYLLFPKSMYQDMRALRSYSTVLPNGRTVKLNKFAPMGSAICFPVEALVFWALSKAAIREATKGGDGDVYVYGDDIIVRREHFNVVCEKLESVGLRVNRLKSYHTGFFRESCGVDAWRGYNLTPARVKQFPPSRSTELESLSNWVAVANMLRERGYLSASDYCVSVVSAVVRLPWNVHGTQLSFIDSVVSSHPAHDERNSAFKFRWNPERCRLEIYTLTFKQKSKISLLAGWPRLHRNLLMNPREPDKWTPRRAVGTRTRWTNIHSYSKVPAKDT